MSSRNKSIVVGIVVIILLIGLFAWGKRNQGGELTTWANTNVACPPDGHQNLALHIHQELAIVIFGEKQVIPINIGINPPVCMAEVHTHEEPGKIHVESVDANHKVTLGDFFAVWNQTFNPNQILDNVNGPLGTVKFLVNGESNTEFEKYILKDNDKIEIRFEPTTVDY